MSVDIGLCLSISRSFQSTVHYEGHQIVVLVSVVKQQTTSVMECDCNNIDPAQIICELGYICCHWFVHATLPASIDHFQLTTAWIRKLHHARDRIIRNVRQKNRYKALIGRISLSVMCEETYLLHFCLYCLSIPSGLKKKRDSSGKLQRSRILLLHQLKTVFQNLQMFVITKWFPTEKSTTISRPKVRSLPIQCVLDIALVVYLLM